MAFKKHRGIHQIDVEVSPDEKYLLFAQVPSEADFKRSLADLFHPADGSPPIIEGWRGFTDTETGEDLIITKDNVRDVGADPFVEGAIWRALGNLRSLALSGELLRKNSQTPPATGPEAAPGTTAAG